MPEENNKSTQVTPETTPAPEAATQQQPAKTPEQVIAENTGPEIKPADQPNEQKHAENNQEKPAEPAFNLKPEDYGNFGMDEKVKMNEDLSKALRDFGIKNKISKDEMNSLVKKYNDVSSALIEKHNNEFAEIKKGWEQKNTDKYKTEVENVYKSIDGFLGSTESGKGFKKFMEENGISKNNDVVDFLYSLSKDYAEDSALRGSGTGDVKPKSAYEILYPEDNQ
jgi:hypothetical protein